MGGEAWLRKARNQGIKEDVIGLERQLHPAETLINAYKAQIADIEELLLHEA
jgi:hypothetical protein